MSAIWPAYDIDSLDAAVIEGHTAVGEQAAAGDASIRHRNALGRRNIAAVVDDQVPHAPSTHTFASMPRVTDPVLFRGYPMTTPVVASPSMITGPKLPHRATLAFASSGSTLTTVCTFFGVDSMGRRLARGVHVDREVALAGRRIRNPA